MFRKLIALLSLLVVCASVNATATWGFSYTGKAYGYDDTSGSGTFQTATSKIYSPARITNVRGSYTDPADTYFGLSPVPILGAAPTGTVPHFIYDNLFSPRAYFTTAGIVLIGRRLPATKLYPDQIGYVNLYSASVAGNVRYYVLEWFPDQNGPGYELLAPVDVTVWLISETVSPPLLLPHSPTLDRGLSSCSNALMTSYKLIHARDLQPGNVVVRPDREGNDIRETVCEVGRGSKFHVVLTFTDADYSYTERVGKLVRIEVQS